MMFLLSACSDDKPKQQAEEKNFEVIVQRIVSEDYIRKLRFYGTFVSDHLISIKAQIPEKVIKIYKEEGDKVDQNDIVLLLEDVNYLNRYENNKINVEEKKLTYNTELELYNSGLSSKSKLTLAELALKTAYNDLESAKIELDKTKIYTPHEGIVDSVLVKEGDVISEVGRELFTVFNPSNIRIVFYATEKELKNLSVDMQVVLNDDIRAKITSISSIAEANKTYKIICHLDGVLEKNDLSVGMRTKLQVYSNPVSVYKIPSSSLALNDEGITGVRVINAQNTVQFLEIKEFIDQDEENFYVVLTEMPVSLDLIIVGQDFVKDGVTNVAIVRNA